MCNEEDVSSTPTQRSLPCTQEDFVELLCSTTQNDFCLQTIRCLPSDSDSDASVREIEMCVC